MPQILIVTDSPRTSGEVVYRERVVCEDLSSSHFAGQLVERVGWAVSDASQLEHRAEIQRRATGDLPITPAYGSVVRHARGEETKLG